MKRIRRKFPTLFAPAAIPAKEESEQEQMTVNGLSKFFLGGSDSRARHAARLLGKYGSTSLVATSADFTAFHLMLTYLGATPVQATIVGRSVGSLVAFLLHRSWVFRHSQKRDGNILMLKYVLGILIGMGLNAAGVWLLNGYAGLEPWPARVLTATTVWLFGFLFNKKIVFG